MSSPVEILEINPKTPVAQMNVEQLAAMFEKWYMHSRMECADFADMHPGNIASGSKTVPIDVGQVNLSISLTPGRLSAVMQAPPSGTPDETCLSIVDNASILIQVPMSSRLELGFWHKGGNPIQVDFLDGKLKTQLSQTLNPGFHDVECKGNHLRFIKLEFKSAECYLWKICYLPE